ncbi:hypothetical protein ACFFX0_26525 [Citricoccus parietis]|uniref:Uncharacterized protein n=1 Tax=Citricoccus parietis TaxID=592307 RepID=A0ABV5G6H2_9MICC
MLGQADLVAAGLGQGEVPDGEVEGGPGDGDAVGVPRVGGRAWSAVGRVLSHGPSLRQTTSPPARRFPRMALFPGSPGGVRNRAAGAGWADRGGRGRHR